MRYEIRQLELGGVLDQAINVTKDHFWLFFKIVALLMIPYALISNLIILWNTPDFRGLQLGGVEARELVTSSMSHMMTIIWITSAINLILIFPLTEAAMIYAIANCYLGKPTSVTESFARAFRIFLPLIGTWLITYLVICLGLILLIVPGVIFAFWYFLVSKIVVIEGTSGTGAMRRSKQLMKGNVGTAFALGIIVGVIGGLIGWAPSLIPQAELQAVIRSVLQGILAIFGAAAWVVFYFSCRCKAENFDLTMLADAVATDETPALDAPPAQFDQPNPGI